MREKNHDMFFLDECYQSGHVCWEKSIEFYRHVLTSGKPKISLLLFFACQADTPTRPTSYIFFISPHTNKKMHFSTSHRGTLGTTSVIIKSRALTNFCLHLSIQSLLLYPLTYFTLESRGEKSHFKVFSNEVILIFLELMNS